MTHWNRRNFIGAGLASLAVAPLLTGFREAKALKLKLSLSQWALHRSYFGNSKEDYANWQRLLATDPDKVLQGPLKPLNFPELARKEFGFEAVEYVNTFFYGRAKDTQYLKELRKRSDGAGVRNLLIMVDEEGVLGHPDAKERTKSIEKHRKWLEAAAALGCHSVRVNAHSIGKKDEQQKLAADALARLCDFAKPLNLDVIIENHGGMSSHAAWLVETIKATGKQNLGTMVDFDNFTYAEDKIWGGTRRYNRYEGVQLLLPFAKSVSAKSYAFDDQGFETTIDYQRMVDLIGQSGFNLYTSVEYEGNDLPEGDGIRATKALLERYSV